MALRYRLSMNWRLVDSGICESVFTVAADEAIAHARSQGLVPNTLHFYRRKGPTVSLGYFQKVGNATNYDFCKQNEICIVRRLTGGSAIYTDSGHLIYGLIVDEPTLPIDRNRAFERVCSAIVTALGTLGVEASFKPINDVLVGGRKISGSAQMRRWGVVLQHGTLIMQNNSELMAGALKMDMEKVNDRGLSKTTYVTSLDEVLGKTTDVEIVKSALVKGFETVFEVNLKSSQLTDFEVERIKNLIENKYGRDDWNIKR
jgi:lipoate-protein ligase A